MPARPTRCLSPKAVHDTGRNENTTEVARRVQHRSNLREATHIGWVLLRKPRSADPGQWLAPPIFPDAAEATSGMAAVP